ncbi:UNVERIFIED_CONTAM: 3D (Asp-Asp-Asp) domain-containing protein [Acetivibrio alkalicellulosi]
MHSMDSTFEELKLKKLLSSKNISYMITGIKKKFPDYSCEKYAQLFSNLVHQFLDRKLSNFTESNKRIIKHTLIKNSIGKPVFEISCYDVFNACIQIKTSSNVQSVCILNELYTWIINATNKDIPKSEFVNYVRSLKSAKIGLDNLELPDTDYSFNTEYEKYIQMVIESETDFNTSIELSQAHEIEYNCSVDSINKSSYESQAPALEINSPDDSSRKTIPDLKILSLINILLHKLLTTLNVSKFPEYINIKSFKIRLLSVFMYIYLNISCVFFVNILPHFLIFKSNPFFCLRKSMNFTYNMIITFIRYTTLNDFKNFSIKKRMACVLVIATLLVSTSYYLNVYSIIASYISDTNDENLSKDKILVKELTDDKILFENFTKEKDYQITYSFPTSLISSFLSVEDYLEKDEVNFDAKEDLETTKNKQENLNDKTEESQVTLHDMLPNYRQHKMRATAYDLSIESCGKDPSHPQYGITASGAKAKKGRTVAVDTSIIPLRTELYIVFPERYSHMNGIYVAEDTGSKIKGNRVDIFFGEDKPGERMVYNEAIQFGVREVTVYILPPNYPAP